MTKSKHIPKRRFKEFELDGAWEQESLGEIVDFSIKTNSLSREKLSLESYEVQNIHYGDVLIKFDNVLDLQRDSLPSIIDSKVLDFKESLLQDGDLIFADAAEDSTVGKAIEVRNIGGKNIVSGLHTIAARPTQLFAPFYLGYYINSNFYHDQILPLMQGTKVSSISKSNLQVTKITFPTIDEQKELGKFFQTIDSLITLHQHKLDKLKNLKKSYLSELFPEEGERVPKRRFPGFEGEWEEKKLKDVSEIYDGTHQTPRYTTDGIMFLSVENIKTLKSNKYISKDDFIKDFKIFPQNGDVLMTRIGDIGTSNVVNTDDKLAFYVSLALIRSAQLDSKFLNTSISSVNFQKELWSRTLHIAFPKKINKNEIGEVSILFPSISEQKQIGSFFQKFDKSISLQQEKLDKLKDLKKAYLNELFV